MTICDIWVFIFSIPTFNHTSLNILKVLLTSLCLSPFFAVLSRALAYVPSYSAFLSLGCAAFFSSLFEYPHHFSFFNCLLEITPCPLFSFIWQPCFPHSSHTKYDTTTSSLYHPNSSKHTLLGIPSLQYSCARLLLHSFFYISCGFVTHATSCTRFFFSFLLIGHSLYLCSFSLYLKHWTTPISSCLLITFCKGALRGVPEHTCH